MQSKESCVSVKILSFNFFKLLVPITYIFAVKKPLRSELAFRIYGDKTSAKNLLSTSFIAINLMSMPLFGCDRNLIYCSSKLFSNQHKSNQ